MNADSLDLGTIEGVPVSAVPSGGAAAPQAGTKTPFFDASNALRYDRQAIIEAIERQTGRRLICYVAGSQAAIDRDDTVGFVDLLHNIPSGVDLDLLLHTGGGDIDAAEKLITMTRNKVGNAVLRVVVPDYAKSSGTLMALGADLIVMSDSSELGPIDPQVILADANGNRVRHSVHNYLKAYETHTATLKIDPGNIAARIMLGKLEPATVKLFESVNTRARVLAENLLKAGMHRDGKGNWSLAASSLINTDKWLTHGQMISWKDAMDKKEIGLAVEHMESDDANWQQYWKLYCRQRLAITDRQKLFESQYASLVVDLP